MEQFSINLKCVCFHGNIDFKSLKNSLTLAFKTFPLFDKSKTLRKNHLH